jgi:AraC family transcriptional regulator of adaptative response/methylated-DNA-[protein]-cysteine methyltransferase
MFISGMIMVMNDMIQLSIPDEETYWQAVAERDTRYNGLFVFGVRSTRIFCQPGCAVRHPRRDQVIFFANGKEARAAGFRACQRCRPDEANDPQSGLAERAPAR